MNKSPPNRRGITFEVGAQLEARDRLKNWYAASIEKIDYDDEKVLIHYRQWSHRYDEWFDWASPYLRPVERIQLRREGLQQDLEGPTPGFRVNDKVLASWSDCRFYPATVLAVNKDASYTVRFYDNVVQTVKAMHVKPYSQIGRFRGGKSRATERKREPSGDGKNWRGREKKPQESRLPSKGKRNRAGSSDQDGDSNTDEEEEVEGHPMRWHHDDEEHDTGQELSSIGLKDGERKMGDEPHVPLGNGGMKAKEGMEQEMAGRNGGSTEDSGHAGGPAADETSLKDGEQAKKTREQGPPESWSGKEDGNSSALKKRRLSVEEALVSKKSKADGHTENGLHNGTALLAEASNQNASAATATSASTVLGLAQPPNSTEGQRAEGQSDVAPPTVTPPVKPVRKQGFHNPNRFSREPLYRVVKNQPPPVLSINLDHNAFKCSAPGCTKSFRKAKLLHYHMKYYHGDMKPPEADLSPNTTATSPVTSATTGGPKQAGAPNTSVRDSPKRRRTISASMHSSQYSPSRTPTSPRSEAKVAVLLGEKRRTSAPPTVDIQLQHHQHQHHQRPLLKEKSKENQLERNVHTNTDRDKSPIDIAAVCLKEREKAKDKKTKDFLRIKLKKKKKKKKSKSDYRGSEENIDHSLFQHQSSKLGLPHKLPPSLSHVKPEAYTRRPGHFHPQPSHVDDEDYGTDWSTDSCGWSDEEAEEECGGVLDPFLSEDDSVAAEEHGSEIVRCVCEVEEDNDFMIQCDECLCWQHGTCMGLLEENVPDKYTCYICRDPPGQRPSLRYWYDREWLSSGHMYGLSFLKENYSHQNARKIMDAHQLLGDVQQVLEVLNGLQLKIGVLQDQSHPDLHLWCQPWRTTSIKKEEDTSFPVGATHSTIPDENTSTTTTTTTVPNGGGGGSVQSREAQRRALSSTSSSSSSAWSSSSPMTSPFQDAFISYISSEHCYQKPCALVVEKRSVAPYMEGVELHGCSTQGPRAYTKQHHTDQESECRRWGGEVKVKQEEEEDDNGYPPSGHGSCTSAQQQQWQTNLLDHIESVQDEVCHRMDFIEKELDVLETCLDYTGELESPEPLSRLPQLKNRIKELMSELGKVQQIALSCSA